MRQTYTIKEKVRQLAVILFPILITQISLSSLGFFDTMMSGHVSQNDLAGVAIGANLWMPVFTGIGGILMALTPMIAQLNGAGRHQEMPAIVLQGLYLAVAIGIFLIGAGVWLVKPLLDMMQLEPAVLDIAYRFLQAIAWGVVPLFLSMTLRNFIDTLGYTRVTMMIVVGTVPINVFLNYLLIFGNFGFPKLGGVGAGYASAITYWIIFGISAFVILKVPPFDAYGIFQKWYRISWAAWREEMRIGLPIGFAIFCETSIFGVVAFLMAKFGTVTIAAHQAAINFAGVVYMLPLSVSMTLTIVVGFEIGAKRFRDARLYTRLGIGLAVAAAVVCAMGLLLFKHQVAGFYTQDFAVLQLTEQFLVYAAFFQLSDAIAAPIQGVLRGYKDVRATFIVALISYWVIGLPIGYALSFHPQWGPFGYWIGFIVGLAAGAAALSARLLKTQRRVIYSAE